ncbi:uroporphyrinogen-III C-methyltransferase [Edwardsiella anguillarum]|uniref:uroporphyrinogen-III C-methyltransferase n=1 Tax=Edwardsiella TaxID=635 RepID=UPI00045C6ABC|nr:uroporphyrinogen-III C-methyltransferase [Edwardsiella anguillarum]AKM46314.1 uroporphyrin-III methyltransferase [Edwardsiella sp. EA181011]GAJ67957.1 protein HemX [Edwardsiella piscicida]RFT04100.1 uroporphyrinogen-III C-methyltransferase [Edwardsiella anguillarum]WHP80434.1 uroporphyrinogen-III C-methyltransferase [Edwardsiella anguillarum]WHQ14339.1 uroporphyrinogen-III C-methyltransferase [Edwardsiella anguillarum]
MTEPTTPPDKAAAAEAATEQTQPLERAHKQDKQIVKKSAAGGPALGAIAIVLVIALGAGLYYHGHQQAQMQQATEQNLQEQLSALHTAQAQEKLRMEALLNKQAKALDVAAQLQASQSQQLKELEQKVAAISGNDANTWKLAQADFMVKLAERKLWSDQDVTTALALLKSADATLAGLDDPSLLGVRRALTEDIATLSALNQIDFDGIILQLNQLANQVDDLRLADNDGDEAPMDQDDGELSASLSQWRQNLAKSWHSFISEFITIRRRDSSAEPLLAPSQDVYLRENIRSRLLIAAQAVPRHQNQIYQQSLESVSAWVRAYFDVNDPSTKAFLNQIDALSQQSVSMILPDALKSQPLLDKLLHARSNALTAAPAAPATQGE